MIPGQPVTYQGKRHTVYALTRSATTGAGGIPTPATRFALTPADAPGTLVYVDVPHAGPSPITPA